MSRIGKQRCPAVGYQRKASSLRQFDQQRIDLFGFVMFVGGDDPLFFDAELFHQPAAVAVFLTDQDVNFGQDADGTQGDVIRIPDRNGNDIKCVLQAHAVIIRQNPD